MRRVLVTGARGFIGRHTLPLLAEAGLEVHAVTSSTARGASGDVVWHEADLLREGVAERVMRDAAPELLLHLAWETRPPAYWHASENVRWLEASLALLRHAASRGVRRVVAAGTCAEYEWAAHPLVERYPGREPDSLYGLTKRALGEVGGRLCAREDVGWAWGRVFFAYGPGEHPSRVVPSVIRSLLAGEPAACSSGEQVRDFIAVEDVAAAFVQLLLSDASGSFNIASGRPARLAEVINRIGTLLGRADLVRLGARPSVPGEPQLIVGDVVRLTSELGWRPRYDLDAGLQRAIEWWSGATVSPAGESA